MNVALYLHIPFCRQRCNYCDFNTFAGLGALIRPYVAALCQELRCLRGWGDWQAKTVYLGGGTPSLLPADLLEEILAQAPLTSNVEVTIEANPAMVTPASLSAWRRAGVNRVSLGVQSAHAGELKLLGRLHDQAATVNAVRWARKASFDNLSLDLIYGLPQQSVASWQQTLELSLGLRPDHFSLYALSVEPGTELAGWVKSGQVPMPDSDLAAGMFEYACDRLAAAGYQHYEISNWALPGYECEHNLYYWRNQPYLGAGAGAWGHWPEGEISWRLRNALHPQDFIQHFWERPETLPPVPGKLPISPACEERERLEAPWAMAETMFMGLRLLDEGVTRSVFRSRFGRDPVQVFSAALKHLAERGWVTWDGESIRLLPAAVLLSNQVFEMFLPDGP